MKNTVFSLRYFRAYHEILEEKLVEVVPQSTYLVLVSGTSSVMFAAAALDVLPQRLPFYVDVPSVM